MVRFALLLGIGSYYTRSSKGLLHRLFKVSVDQGATELFSALEERYMHQFRELQDAVMMQLGVLKAAAYGAFLSWENQWHAWGNNQASAMLKSYQSTSNESSLEKALIEIDNFYPYAKANSLSDFIIVQQNGERGRNQIHQYPQIANSTVT